MRGRRKTVNISEAEWRVMKVLWDGFGETGKGMTLGEVVQRLADGTGWSNTTIRTLIMRLADKEAIEIDKSTGVYKYIPQTSKEDCIRSEIDSFTERVFDNSTFDLIASAVREGKLNTAEKKELVRLLKLPRKSRTPKTV